MPRMGELGDCPLCFGRLEALSVCQSCNTVAVREGLADVAPQITCEDCGAVNPTHFVCTSCTARYPYEEIVKAEGPTCPVCKKPVLPGAELCPHCSAVLPLAGAGGARPKRRIRGEYTEEDVQEVGRIPSVGHARGEALCAAGYNALWKISRASEAELAEVSGIGPKSAAAIKEALRFLLLMGRKKSKEEVLSEEYECPLCGTVTSLFATQCHGCGATFDMEEVDEDFRKEIERDEEKALLAYYDVRLLEHRNSVSLLYARATLLFSAGRAPEALEGFDRVLELEPRNRKGLQAKARALAHARGIGSASQILRDIVAAEGLPRSAGETPTEEEALRALTGLEEGEVECPECGEKQVAGAKMCPVCGHRFAPEEPTLVVPPSEVEPVSAFEDLERAVAGETKAPPPPLQPEVPESVVDKKRYMLAFLLKLPGVSRRAAEAVSGFFQDVDQIGKTDIVDVEKIPGVASAEARLIKEAVDKFIVPAEEAPPTPPSAAAPVSTPPPRPPPRRTAPEPGLPQVPEPGPRLAAPRAVPAAPRPRAMEITTARRGMINGRGLVNGRGRVNGLINGSGFVNGSSIAELRLPRKRFLPRYVAIAMAMLMLFAGVVSLISPAPPGGPMQIDGSFGDWTGVREYAIATVSSNPNVAIQAVYLTTSDSEVFLRAKVTGTAFGDANAYDTLYAFLDGDASAATGYNVSGIGAEFLVRVSGSNGTVDDARLLRFESANRDDWSGWATVSGTVRGAAGTQGEDGKSVEAAVPVDALIPAGQPAPVNPTQLQAVFTFDDNDDHGTHTDVPINGRTPSLRVTQESASANDTVVAGPNPFLRIKFRAFGLQPGGTVRVESIATGASGGSLGVSPPPFDVGAAEVERDLTLDPGNLPEGSTVEARVLSVQLGAAAPVVIAGPPARAYVKTTNVTKRIDGLFQDWPSPRNDNDSGPNPIRRPSLDIAQYDGSTNQTSHEVFLYLRLAGPVLEGLHAPERLRRPIPAQQGGGGNASGSPAPPPPPRFGEDYIRFYVQTNASAPDGYPILGLGADRLVDVRGQGGVVRNASVYDWNGGAWQWEANADAGLGTGEIEIGTILPTVTFDNAQIVATTADWSGVADRTMVAATRGGTRGGGGTALGPPRVMDVGGNGVFWLRNVDSSETACTYNKVARNVHGPGPTQTITLSSGGAACWYVEGTQGATISSGTWESLLDISNTDGAHYNVRFQIWDTSSDTQVGADVLQCLDVNTFGDDVRCFMDAVAQQNLMASEIVRLVVQHASASGTIIISYDGSGTSADSRLTLPIPEFSDLLIPMAFLLALVPVRRASRRRRARKGARDQRRPTA